MVVFLVHLFIYAAVNAFLVAVWVLTDGSVDELRQILGDPAGELSADVWPVWPILAWGTVVMIHLGVAVTVQFSRAARRGRERARRGTPESREIAKQAGEMAVAAARNVAELTRRAVERRRGSVPTASGAGRRTPERLWVTVMFTDIVNSTQLTEALGDEEWTRLLRRHRELVREAYLTRDGDEVGTQGDGFLVRFQNPAQAVLAGVDIQRALAEQREAGGVVPRVRVGIHAGEAVEDDGDLVGRVVNVASRVASEAEPDEILVTEPVADYVGDRLELEDRGVRALRGVAQARHLLAVKWAGAPLPSRDDEGTEPERG